MSECTAGESRAGKYLTFSLAPEAYGIPILKVKEIIGMMPITSVPRVPDYVKGVINLRGKVLPVIDLRLKFGLEEIDYTERTCIIVVEIAGASGPQLPRASMYDTPAIRWPAGCPLPVDHHFFPPVSFLLAENHQTVDFYNSSAI